MTFSSTGKILYYVEFYTDVIGYVLLDGGGVGKILQDAFADLSDVGYASGYIYFIGWNRQ